jgi:hypothetical protein
LESIFFNGVWLGVDVRMHANKICA